MNSWALVFSYSFDTDTAVYLFDTLEEAKKTLWGAVAEEVRILREEDGCEAVSEISKDSLYGRITVRQNGMTVVQEVRIGNVYRWEG